MNLLGAFLIKNLLISLGLLCTVHWDQFAITYSMDCDVPILGIWFDVTNIRTIIVLIFIFYIRTISGPDEIGIVGWFLSSIAAIGIVALLAWAGYSAIKLIFFRGKINALNQ